MTARDEVVVVLTRDGTRAGVRPVAVEAPIAIEVNGLGYAVMMATPAALDDFTIGFLLTERLADDTGDVLDLDIHEAPSGWIVRATLAGHCAGRIHDRVRHRTSDTACGLCGIAGIEQVRRPVAGPPPLPNVPPAALFAALEGVRDAQPLNRATGAMHAAAWCDSAGRVVAAREDVGRHNALDKLIGARARTRAAAARDAGFLLVTSRISFEMVDKALVARAPLLVGISAPTTMAVDHARRHGLTLIALARADTMLVLNDPGARFAGGSEGGT